MPNRLAIAPRVFLAATTLVLLGSAGVAAGQTAPRPSWTFTVSAGGFARGNGHAVAEWLRRNAYGATPSDACVFDILLNRICSASESYPKVTGRSVAAGMLSVSRRLSDRVSVEGFVASEQSGTATGHCDSRGVPRDVRCREEFMVVNFSGGSLASLAVLSVGHMSLGAGPALLLANWRMKPAHLPGVWIDATSRLKSPAWIVRAQYRMYRPATRAPADGFSGLHPSTLFLGVGFVGTTNN